MDLADVNASAALVESIERDFGPIYGLINNAAIAPDGLLATQDVGAIAQTIDVDLTATLLLTRAVARRMLLRKQGRIIMVSSVIAHTGFSGLVPYAAAKAGLEGAVRALCREMGRARVTVNAIAPGYLETDMTADMGDKQRQQVIRRTPLGRLGQAEDVTAAARFLLSEEAAFITGQSLVVDGGMSA
ncbi:putative short-chain dehydrogenase/reductase SDR [Magnetofaba australis IT-1]|uniref:Putative short-chain dehydrogenase/reductase SDR n=1 Tax=Magnetofaba australis IT-1 TaxID=1434232 RepID=A0A1Y2K061_9PROT|nr:putative short-chain dehydrogenase/reductase SDR [Magnetofaba australis IT-1]